jgi:hypothetical protein
MSPLPPEASPPERWYDAELPFLQALEREVARGAQRAGQAPREQRAQRPRRPPARIQRSSHTRRGSHARTTTRMARRALTLVALLCLLGASAFGAREALSGAGSNPSVVSRGAFVLVAHGVAGAESWSLQAYRLGPDLCRVLLAPGSEGSSCSPAPALGAVEVTSSIGALQRYVFGVTGPRIAWVAVRASGTVRRVRTRALSPARARRAGLPPNARYFVAAFTRPYGAPDPPVLVSGLDSARRRVGALLASCIEGEDSRQCPG